MRNAFTLIELLAVLALVALLTGVASLSLKGTLRDAEAEDAAGRLVAFDALARQEARRFNRPSELHVDPRRGRVFRSELSPSGGAGADGAALALPPAVAIEGVFTAGGHSRGGGVTIACSARGRTASYAVLLRGPGGRRRWVMFAGLTGRADVIENERDVQDIFSVLSEP